MPLVSSITSWVSIDFCIHWVIHSVFRNNFTLIIYVSSFKINGALIVKLVSFPQFYICPALQLQTPEFQSPNFYHPYIFFNILIGVFQYIFETGWIVIKYWSLTDINMENGKPVYFTSEILYPYSALPKHPVLFP